jgi:hypothetical protein
MPRGLGCDVGLLLNQSRDSARVVMTLSPFACFPRLANLSLDISPGIHRLVASPPTTPYPSGRSSETLRLQAQWRRRAITTIFIGTEGSYCLHRPCNHGLLGLTQESRVADLSLVDDSLGVALTDSLDELIGEERIDPQLAMKVLTQFDRVIAETLQEKVKARLTFKVTMTPWIAARRRQRWCPADSAGSEQTCLGIAWLGTRLTDMLPDVRDLSIPTGFAMKSGHF